MHELTRSRLLFSPLLILMQVQIIRDNLISSLNHCDLVYSVSLGCSTPLFPSITFQFSFLFLAPSLVVSLNSALASPMPLGGSSALVCLCLSLCLLQYSTALAVGPKERMLLQGNQTLQQVILSRHTVWVSLCKCLQMAYRPASLLLL